MNGTTNTAKLPKAQTHEQFEKLNSLRESIKIIVAMLHKESDDYGSFDEVESYIQHKIAVMEFFIHDINQATEEFEAKFTRDMLR